MNEKIKLCPFCVEEPDNRYPMVIVKTEAGQKKYQVVCENCGARGPEVDTYAGALESWQYREEPKL